MDTRTIDELQTLVGEGVSPKYVFFWGHKPKVPGSIDESCLSNWFPAKFNLSDDVYPTTEHFMMAEKARLFEDGEILSQILAASSPGEAKSLGRKVSGFDDEVWKERRFEIVVAGNLAKFSQNDEMGDLLLRTGSKVLVEASPRDRIWGVGMGKTNPDVENPLLWKGLNLLGFALMEVRAQLASQT